jgi:hypothetical protein
MSRTAREYDVEPVTWQRCEIINKAEQDSLRTIFASWKAAP